jgi:carbon storage regulator
MKGGLKVLILSRKSGESFLIGDNIEVFILDVQNDKIKVGINAPLDIKITRKELKEIEKANIEAAFGGKFTQDLINRVNFIKKL